MQSRNLNYLYQETSQTPTDIFNKHAESLSSYIDDLKNILETKDYAAAEASIIMPGDEEIFSEVSKVVDEKINDKLKLIVVIGIGGPSTGASSVYEAIRGKEYNYIPGSYPKMLFLDTLSPRRLELIFSVIDREIETSEEILVNVISKSGTTTETVCNFEVVYDYLTRKFSNINDRVVVTSDQGSKLWNLAIDKGISTLGIPEVVGGRFSVMSSFGLFPLMMAGIYVEDLVDGAISMRDMALKLDPAQNPALASAIISYFHYRDGKNVTNNFFFNPELEQLGKWQRQLIGESIGKKNDITGKEIRNGITPVISVGTMDLHSTAQLYYGGPKDKFTTIIYSEQETEHAVVPGTLNFPGLIEGIELMQYKELMNAIVGGVKRAYENNELPFAEIILPEISAYTVGQFQQMKMMETMYLAKLMNINAFDQPSVEDYKSETRALLAKQ